MKDLRYIIVLTVAVLYLQACGNSDGETSFEEPQVIPAVEVVQAELGGLPLEERLNGIVRSANQVDIYPRITAPIEEIYVQNGDRVQAGTPLVKLRDNEFQERLRQAEASLRINMAQQRQAEAALGEIQSQLRRERVLAERDLSSDLELEQLEARLESGEASLQLAIAQVEQAESSVEEQKEVLEQTVVKAPVNGTVGGRVAEVGMQANTNSRLFTVGDLTRSKITINLTERMLGYIETGMEVNIFSENMPDTVLTSEISRISPFLGEGNFSTEAEIDINNNDGLLLPGMFVTVDVLYGESEQATIIPLSAIHRKPQTGEEGVYVATSLNLEAEILEQPEDNQQSSNLSNPTDIEFIPIEIIAQGRDAAGVDGIRSGDWVVTVGQNLLERDASGTARVRPVTWKDIVDMQRLQPQDLLRQIMDQNVVEQSGTN